MLKINGSTSLPPTQVPVISIIAGVFCLTMGDANQTLRNGEWDDWTWVCRVSRYPFLGKPRIQSFWLTSSSFFQLYSDIHMVFGRGNTNLSPKGWLHHALLMNFTFLSFFVHRSLMLCSAGFLPGRWRSDSAWCVVFRCSDGLVWRSQGEIGSWFRHIARFHWDILRYSCHTQRFPRTPN